jgi:YidC/Oxa1 family membrane protein insertase
MPRQTVAGRAIIVDIGKFFATLFGPIGNLFQVLFFQPVFNVLMLIYHFIPNFGVSIILLTLLIRCALIPLTRAQLRSSKAMQELQPHLKELQAKYRSDPQRLMAEQQALYKANGVNPVQGCLPLLIQLPFLYALFFSFQKVLNSNLRTINASIYFFLPKLTAYPDLHFLGINLAHPAPFLAIIAGALTFLQLRMAMPYKPKAQRGGQQDAMTQSTSMMQYIMPLFTVFFGWNFPAGMALYWCVTTTFSAVQQYFIGGWGSLFLGTPWEAKYSKPPKSITTTVAPAIAGAGARGVVASPPPAAPAEGGFRGLLKQMRETLSAAQQTAAEQAAGRAAGTNGAGTNGAHEASNAAPGANGASKSASSRPGGPSSYTKNQKPRPPKSGVKLVKPSATDPRPEDEIRRDATSSANGKAMTPEDAIKRDAATDSEDGETGA